ncbi:MAG TPA: ATP-binding protein, partial [Caulobacter sp.]|nr:ATP-binding protein [Caulobacter sp.]
AYRALEAVAKAPDVASVRLTDMQGQVVAQVGVAEGAEVDTVVRPIKLGARQVGALSLSARRPSLTDIMARDLALTGTLFFGSAGLAILLANGLARRMTKPMERLSNAMREVAADGRFKPVEQAADDDVFHSLTSSFNHLVARLEINDHDLRGAMAELVKARDDANAANVLKSHFLANMSHEIRTPLNGVLAMTEVMAMGELSAAQRERLSVIRESGTLLLSVLNDVLDLSKIEAGRLDLVERDFDLASLALSIRESYATQARAKNLDFGVFVAPEALGSWRGDVDRLRQILGNLVSNALKFTLEGSVSVRFASSDDGAGLRVDVVDTGIGIDAETLPRLFDKFVQADSSTTRRFGGSGLGLSICNELATLMGGRIDARAVVGRGAIFQVDLSLTRIRAVEDAAPNDEEEVSLEGLRVLVAEDHPTNQKVVEIILQPFDVDLTMVEDGQAALDAFTPGAFDAILMDMQMPVMDGLTATCLIREREAAAGAPPVLLIMLTANAMEEHVSAATAAGADL